MSEAISTPHALSGQIQSVYHRSIYRQLLNTGLPTSTFLPLVLALLGEATGLVPGALRWVGVLVMLQCARWMHLRLVLGSGRDTFRLSKGMAIGAFANGVLWGVASWSCFHSRDLTVHLVWFAAMFGACAWMLQLYLGHRGLMALQAIPSLLPLLPVFGPVSETDAAAALVLLALLGVVFWAAGRVQGNARSMLRERLRTEQLSRDLAELAEEQNVILRSVDIGIVRVDEGMIHRVNPHLSLLLGRDEAALVGQPMESLGATEADAEILRTLASPDGFAGTSRRDVELRRGDGHVVRCEATVTALVREGRRSTIWSFASARERIGHEQGVLQPAYDDALTGLRNRRGFEERVRMLLRGMEQGSAGALFIIDLGRFEPLGERAGHPGADLLLQGVAERLGKALRGTDLIARLEGGRFAVFTPGVNLPGVADEMALRLGEMLSSPFQIDGRRVSIDARVRVAVAAPDDSLESLWARADAQGHRIEQAEGNGRSAIATASEGI